MLKFRLMLTTILVTIRSSNAGILLWSRHDLQIPALKYFDGADFAELNRNLNYPKKIAFLSESSNASEILRRIINTTGTAYVPNADLDVTKIDEIELHEVNDNSVGIFEETLKNDGNVLILLLVSEASRPKREATANVTIFHEVPKGPVMYAKDEMMIYSARPPVLRTESYALTLGRPSLLISRYDRNLKKFIVTTGMGEDKVTLRFGFVWSNGYWSLKVVEVDKAGGTINKLDITKDVGAPRNYSYHCFGETVFRDAANGMELLLYEVQVQPDAKFGRFDSAVDCVPFTTAPIWSGLFVVFILIVALLIGLSCLADIKTTTSFDNLKNKQLSIAVAD